MPVRCYYIDFSLAFLKLCALLLFVVCILFNSYILYHSFCILCFSFLFPLSLFNPHLLCTPLAESANPAKPGGDGLQKQHEKRNCPERQNEEFTCKYCCRPCGGV